MSTTSDLASPASMLALDISGVSKTFVATRVLDSFSMDVSVGEVHAIVGQNGSGKSTLIKILSGFHTVDDPAQSVVSIRGERLHLHDVGASHNAGLRFVHQDLGLVDGLNTVENLGLGVGFSSSRLGRVNWRAEEQAARERLADLGYDFDVRIAVGKLRAAERTGVAIARAIADADNVRVLVLDEPTANLPSEEVKILFGVIERLRKRGVGIIYVSHRLSEVFDISQRVTILLDGTKVGTYATGDLNLEKLINLMVPVRIANHGRDPATSENGSQVVMTVEGVCGPSFADLTFDVREGEVLGIAGLTGSGRDELLPALFGALRRSGRVSIDQKMLRPRSVAGAIDAGCALIPASRAELGSIATMTVSDNLVLSDVKRHSGVLGATRRTRVREEVEYWIDALDVRPPSPEAPFASLSGGNQQKVVLAKWLRTNPRVLLADEPTQGVDVAAKATIHQRIREASASGTAVIVASSDERELSDLCDRVIVLRDGRLVGSLTGTMNSPGEISRLQH